MGYAKEKAKTQRKLWQWKFVLLFVVVGIFLALCVLGFFYPPKTWKYYFSLPKVGERGEGEMRVHFLDVGQGDCTIVELPDGRCAMVDGGTGEEDAVTAIMRYLHALKLEKLDYLLVSHAAEDHCGGLKTVLESVEVGQIYLPLTSGTVSESYAAFVAEATKQGVAVAQVNRARKMIQEDGKDYVLSCLYPYSTATASETDENLNCSVFWLDYRGVSVLFAGDAPMATESLLMRDDRLGVLEACGARLSSVEVLKVAHHGSRYSTSADFLQYTGVKTAIVPCGENNTYGHPHKETLDRLQSAGVEVFQTDAHGSVIVTVFQNGEYRVETLGK